MESHFRIVYRGCFPAIRRLFYNAHEANDSVHFLKKWNKK